MENRIKELEELIKKYARSYYTGESEISDEEFDKLVNELKQVDPDNSLLNTPGWGYDPSKESGKKSRHIYGVIRGLSKVHDLSEVPDYLKSIKTRVSAKLDGLSVVCYYKNGTRVRALTRGDGVLGRDVTDKIDMITPETKNLESNFSGAVRGEVLITLRNWDLLVNDHNLDDDPRANPRNYASGILNRNEIDKDIKYLSYVTYKVVADESHQIESCQDASEFLQKEGFNVVSHSYGCNFTDMTSLEEKFKEYCECYPCDGLVLTKCETTTSGDEIIYDEIAYKFPAEQKEVTVTDVEWRVTRTGRLVPRIWFTPVVLSGAVVQKCTGFNARYIKDNHIKVGTKLVVHRSGEVIPYIVKVLHDEEEVFVDDLYTPMTCPNCDAVLVWNGDDLICENENENQLIMHFIWTVAPVDGAGWSLYNQYIEINEISDFQSLVDHLKKCKDHDTQEIVDRINGVGGSVTRSKMIQVMKTLGNPISPVTFLVACNINGVSWTTAQSILDYFPNFCNDPEGDDLNRLYEIKGIGYSLIESIRKNMRRIVNLRESVIIGEHHIEEVAETKFTVAITGALSMKRADFDKLLNDHGISQSSNFNEIKYLITNNPDSGSSKMKKAKDKGVEIISEDDFVKKFFN